ncbi:h domain protein [Nocardia sp. NPDC051463]|uniref:h domain protein n=1 Tax=Nocardia sp. NPDC051463 TaxID=3154845 RepID=UPI00344D4E1E
MSGLRGKILLLVTAVIVVVAGIVAGINGYRYWDDRRSEQSRTEAVDAADRTVSAMFTYDYKTVDTELPKAADQLSASFRDDYLKLIKQAIAPGAKEKQLSVKATTEARGVVSADSARAVVLIFLNQVTTSQESPQGTSTGSRVRVTLDKDDDHWLVSQVTPI